MTRDAGAGTDQPPIGDYAVVGDCRTAALISKSGSVDWLCLPRFDAPSVFGALLDSAAGGRFRVGPAASAEVHRRYLQDSNVLETTFHGARGTLRVTDAMTVPVRGEDRLFPDHELLRRVECVEGEVDVEVVCDPRFDYGRRCPPGRARGALGIQWDGEGTALALRADLPLRPREGGGWGCVATLRDGDVRHLSLTSEHAAPLVLRELGPAADVRLDATVQWWREWVGTCAYDGDYRDLVYRSMLALKLLIYPPSGAILAAATTSLPEAPGGERNWDYRYCWLRDASMTIEVLLHLGFAREGEAFLGWLLHATRLSRPELQVLYDVHGRTDHPAGTLPHLAGYRGAQPVRFGNEAVRQRQLDLYGEVLRAAWAFVDRGGALDHAEASLLADLGEQVCETWDRPDNGIWEVRGERRHYTHSKAMCWVALRCLLDLADANQLSPKRSRRAIEAAMDAIRQRTEHEAWSDALDSYVAWYGGDDVDAALLLLGIVGYADPAGERMAATRQAIRERLGDGDLLRRYRYDDRLPGTEGAFGICAFWEAQLLARQGRIDAARARFEAAAAYSNDLGLFSEEMDPSTGDLLGNFPQAFTHIGLLGAATEIARARGRPPERQAAAPTSTEAETE